MDKLSRILLSHVPVKQTGVCVALLFALVFSEDWCFSAFLACMIALVVVSLIDTFLKRYITLHSHWLYKLRLGVAVLVSATIGANMPLNEDWAFQEAFGVPRPINIQRVKLTRHYEGGPGEHTLLMEFQADETIIQEITSQRTFIQDSDRVREWISDGGDWSYAFEFFSAPGRLPFSRRSWHQITPIDGPQVYDWDAAIHSTIIFWDNDSGRTVVLNTRS